MRLFLTEEGRALSEKAMSIQTELIERTLSATPIEDCLKLADNMDLLIQRLLLSDGLADTELSEDRG